MPKMRKKWMYRKLEALGISPGWAASLSPGAGSGGARGQELVGAVGGAGSGRVGLEIWNEDDQSYQRTFSFFFLALSFSSIIV
jgi:hypothetical protein